MSLCPQLGNPGSATTSGWYQEQFKSHFFSSTSQYISISLSQQTGDCYNLFRTIDETGRVTSNCIPSLGLVSLCPQLGNPGSATTSGWYQEQFKSHFFSSTSQYISISLSQQTGDCYNLFRTIDETGKVTSNCITVATITNTSLVTDIGDCRRWTCEQQANTINWSVSKEIW